MSNTEINSLFEIAINLENKGLYAQADKARNIMIRLSQTSTAEVKLQELINSIISQIENLGPFLKASGQGNFLGIVKSFSQKISQSPIAKTFGKVLNFAMAYEVLNSLIKAVNLSSKFNWTTFFSGEDTTGQEIAIEILNALANFCFLFDKFYPPFRFWGTTFLGLFFAEKWGMEKAKSLGYELGGMPGGVEQMRKIETFDLRDPDNITDPDVKFILSSIKKELGIELSNPNLKSAAAKLPKILSLDFWEPYVHKYDKNNKFKNLSDPNVPETLQLKSGLLNIAKIIKLFNKAYNETSKGN
jgi:hypothetical protein